MHVLITRPKPEAAELKAKLEALGHTVSVEPLLRIEPLTIDPAAFVDAGAVIATSRNGLRALAASASLAPALALPLFTVGPATEELARTLGFQRIIAGDGAASDLVPLIAASAEAARGPLVHVAGEALACDLAAALKARGLTVRTVTAYRAVAAPALTHETATCLAAGALDAVLLMSPRTAAIFAQLVGKAGHQDPARRLAYVCLSQAVAAALRDLAPPRIETAVRPNSAAIIDALGRVATGYSGV